MAIKPIRGNTGTATVTVNGVAKTCLLNVQEYESVVPQEQIVTFCTESAPTFDPGIEVMSFRLMGFLFYDDATAAPFFPLSALQGVSYVGVLEVGCSVSGTVNFSRAMIRRAAGVRGVMSGEGVFTGVVVVAWDITP